MARKAGTIVISLSAGTAQFMADMDRAQAKIKDFGSHSVSNTQAAGAAIREVMGGSNVRAVEQFASKVLGLGPLLQAIFPVVGAAAFAGLLGEIGSKAYEFFRTMDEAGKKTAQSFRELNQPIRLANDELEVANDRLEIEIAKLSGQHTNTLKLMLDEAVAASDKLAISLEKDLSGLNKLLSQNVNSFWDRLLGGSGVSKEVKEAIGGYTGAGGATGRAETIVENANQRIYEIANSAKKGGDLGQAAKDVSAISAKALAAADKELADALTLVNTKLKEQQELKRAGDTGFWQNGQAFAGYYNPDLLEKDSEGLQGAKNALQETRRSIPLQLKNVDLTTQKEKLEANNANAKQDRPFEDRMKAMAAQIEQVQAKLGALGQSDAAQRFGKAFGEAQVIIAEVNKALERYHIQLDAGQKTELLWMSQKLVDAQAETEWKTRLEASATSIADRIRSQELLTAAIGKGYEATRQANIETRLMSELGAKYSDPAWLKTHQPDVARLRTGFGDEFDAQHNQQSAQTIEKLKQQIELENALADAQMRGAEAVRQAGLAVRLRQAAEQGATKEQIQAELELYNAQRANANATDLAKLKERIEATQRLTAALLGGAEAERKAALENKYAEIRRQGDEAIPGVLGMGAKEMAERQADQLDHQRQIGQEALRTGLAYQDQLQSINEQVAKLKQIKADQGDSLAIEISLRDLENRRLETLAQESLALRGARDGVRAFFIEMQKDAKSAASIIYDSLNEAVDKVSSNLARLMTGQKTNWGKAFQEIGNQMLESSIKSELQTGLGQLGKKYGIDLGGVAKPDGTFSNPIWVQMKGAQSQQGTPQIFSGVPGLNKGGLFGGGSQGGGVFSLLGNLFKGGGGSSSGDTPSVHSTIHFAGFRADGGGVDPGNAYVVGERGPELFMPRQSGSIVPNGAGGGVTIQNNIDARGADLGAANRLHRVMEQSSKAAVVAAVKAHAELSARRPK